MKELNISKILLEKRREKGVTQDEVAEYMGVSKAAVSKWEKGISYPDITFLPQLATYFHITIDELMGYEPQLSEKEIQKKYREFSAMFAERPFFEVMGQIRELIRKYDGCYPLLFSMAQLYLNHFMLLSSDEEKSMVLKEAEALCRRITEECRDALLKKDALTMEALLHLMEGQPEKVLERLGTKVRPSLPEDQFIALAYQMLGEREKAMEYLQVTLYTGIVEQLDCMSMYYSLASQEKKAECALRLEKYIHAFSLDKLVPHKIVGLYFGEARNAMQMGKMDEAMDSLELYVNTLEQRLADFTIHGDSFFYAIDDWLGTNGMNSQMPRDIRLIKKDLIKEVTENPVFAPLKDRETYRSLVKRLEAI